MMGFALKFACNNGMEFVFERVHLNQPVIIPDFKLSYPVLSDYDMNLSLFAYHQIKVIANFNFPKQCRSDFYPENFFADSAEGVVKGILSSGND